MFRARILTILYPLVSLAACSSSSTTPPAATSTGTPHHDAGATVADSGHVAPYPAPEPDTCITDVTPGVQQPTCEGLKFNLSVPESCLTAPCGLITDVHGYVMTGDLQDAHSNMQKLGGAKGYIVLQPWAPGMGLTASWSAKNDDAVFALMQHVINVWHVDPKRVHFDGYSMGGWMTWRFVCKHSDILASAAPLAAGAQAGGGSCAFAGAEMPARQIPILYTHGRQDGLVKFTTAIPQRDAVLAAWYPGAQPKIVQQASDYEWDRYTSADGTVFEFLQHDWAVVTPIVFGGSDIKGHCFPGVGGTGKIFGCGVDTAVKWPETVVQFFVDHPMK